LDRYEKTSPGEFAHANESKGSVHVERFELDQAAVASPAHHERVLAVGQVGYELQLVIHLYDYSVNVIAFNSIHTCG
jgi:hypothetical protein